MKRNLERTYCKLANEPFSSVEYARTIFTLSWFHAIVQERRTYIPQGWCKFYEFSDSDLLTALRIVQKRFENGKYVNAKLKQVSHVSSRLY